MKAYDVKELSDVERDDLLQPNVVYKTTNYDQARLAILIEERPSIEILVAMKVVFSYKSDSFIDIDFLTDNVSEVSDLQAVMVEKQVFSSESLKLIKATGFRSHRDPMILATDTSHMIYRLTESEEVQLRVLARLIESGLTDSIDASGDTRLELVCHPAVNHRAMDAWWTLSGRLYGPGKLEQYVAIPCTYALADCLTASAKPTAAMKRWLGACADAIRVAKSELEAKKLKNAKTVEQIDSQIERLTKQREALT